MTEALLYLKGRRVPAVLAGVLLLAVVGKILGARSLLIGEGEPVPIPWAILLPAVAAYLVATVAVSPLPWMELTAYRRAAQMSPVLLVAVAAAALLLLWWGTGALPPPLSAPAVARAFLGLLGVALAGILLGGTTLGWIAPTSLVFAAVLFVGGGQVTFLPIDWVVQPDDHRGAWLFAAAHLACGFALAVTRRSRLKGISD